MAVLLANNKLCAMRSNMKQTMFNQFKGRFSIAHTGSDIAIALMIHMFNVQCSYHLITTES